MSKLIIGLGNPGEQYKNNRHNVGFKIIDSLAKKLNVTLDKAQFNGVYGVALVNNEKIVLAKPNTYMNLSGDFVGQFVRYYNVSPEDLIIVHDDVDTKLGEVKLRTSGSSGGQNGLKDIITKLNTEQFKRIKIGIGPKNPKIPLANFVLDNFSRDEMQVLSGVINTTTSVLMNLDKTAFSNLLDYVKRNG